MDRLTLSGFTYEIGKHPSVENPGEEITIVTFEATDDGTNPDVAVRVLFPSRGWAAFCADAGIARGDGIVVAGRDAIARLGI